MCIWVTQPADPMTLPWLVGWEVSYSSNLAAKDTWALCLFNTDLCNSICMKMNWHKRKYMQYVCCCCFNAFSLSLSFSLSPEILWKICLNIINKSMFYILCMTLKVKNVFKSTWNYTALWKSEGNIWRGNRKQVDILEWSQIFLLKCLSWRMISN